MLHPIGAINLISHNKRINFSVRFLVYRSVCYPLNRYTNAQRHYSM